MTQRPDHQHRSDSGDDGGEVSDVSGMDDAQADEAIEPEDATAGAPESDTGGPDEGPLAPTAQKEGSSSPDAAVGESDEEDPARADRPEH